MSRIEKLSIMGVRSFAPNHQEAISFNTPLTLIVGFNGSGKTTIIECLKYATSGQLPPNSKNGAFIHDPNLVGESLVKAQVKLSFRSTAGEVLVLTRNLQLSVTKKARSQKSLEGTLKLRNTGGERHVVSSRAAELDALVPEKLGVSPAVLDLVIFCHQDDSTWPMLEPSKLKEKFDKIFEAQRYTQAVTQLAVTRKNQGELLRKYEEQEKVHRSNKERGERQHRKIDDLMRELLRLETKEREYKALIEDLDQQISSKRKEANKFSSEVDNLQWKVERHELLQNDLFERQLRIDPLDETEERLAEVLEQYEGQTARIQEDHDQKTTQYRSFEVKRVSAQDSLKSKVSERGKYLSDKDKYERQLKSRKTTVQEAAKRHGIRGYEGEFDDDKVQTFKERLQQLLHDKKRELARLKEDNAEKSQQVHAEVSSLEGEKIGLNKARAAARHEISNIDRSINDLEEKINALDVDEDSVVNDKCKMADLEAKLEKAKADESNPEMVAQKQQEQERLDLLTSEHERLARDMKVCSKLSSERAQLDVRKKELSDSKRELDTLSNTYNERLCAMLGSQWRLETLSEDYQTLRHTRMSAVEHVEKQRSSSKATMGEIRAELAPLQKRLTKAESDKSRCQSVVEKALLKTGEGRFRLADYLDELAQLQEDLKQVDTDIQLFDYLQEYYKKARNTAEQLNKCHLCDRTFAGDQPTKSRVLDKIRKTLGDQQKQELLKDKAELEHKFDILQGVRLQYDDHERLSKEIPGLSNEARDLSRKQDELVELLTNQDSSFKKAEEKLREVESLGKIVGKIDEVVKRIEEKEQEVQGLTCQQSILGSPVRSLEEVQALQEKCNAEMKAANAKIHALTGELSCLAQKRWDLEKKIGDLNTTMAKTCARLDRKKGLQEQVQSQRRKSAEQIELISKANVEAEASSAKLEKAKTLRDELDQQARAQEQRLFEERDKLVATVDELKRAEREIQNYIARGGPDLLASTEHEIADLEQNLERLDHELKTLGTQINKLAKEIDNSDQAKQNIKDNLYCRSMQRKIEQLEREIGELQSRDARRDFDRLRREVDRLEEERKVLTTKSSKNAGVSGAKDQELQSAMEEYDQEYKDAKDRYREANVLVQTTKAAIQDIGVYAAALDKAVMQYHTLKMEEVNRIAAELWQSTYQGTDIDTILVRADVEGTSASSSRRSFNYRLCMVKGGVEMDMRGRCSAGQKVLACIIIRLALAESFGVSCGLIALDEPTTNLDSDNIRSLAESLHAIIKHREGQRNLQLIVITHDEEFLKHMQCSDFCDNFYRVKRDENQNSVIGRETITRLMDS